MNKFMRFVFKKVEKEVECYKTVVTIIIYWLLFDLKN